MATRPGPLAEHHDCSSRTSASVLGHRLLRNPKVIEYLNHRMIEHEMPNQAIESLKRSLNATKVVTINGKMVEVPDHNAQAKARDQAFKLMGAYDFAKCPADHFPTGQASNR